MRPLTLRTILVAADRTPAQRSAIRTAADLAALTDGRLHVAHAIENGRVVEAQDVLEEIREIVADKPVDIDVLVMRGPPGAVVGQEARRVGADVVLLGPHRRDQTGTLGSTADRVVRTSATPCLILPIELRLPLRRVLVPVDSSAGARGALAVALTWASALRDRRQGTRVIALHVAAPLRNPADPHDHEADVKALENEVDSVRNNVAGIAHVNVESVVIHEEPEGEAIVNHADRNDIDLIVIGTRGSSMSAAAILGSTSSVVVRNTSCPVLLVPPELWIASDDESM